MHYVSLRLCKWWLHPHARYFNLFGNNLFQDISLPQHNEWRAKNILHITTNQKIVAGYSYFLIFLVLSTNFFVDISRNCCKRHFHVTVINRCCMTRTDWRLHQNKSKYWKMDILDSETWAKYYNKYKNYFPFFEFFFKVFPGFHNKS